MRNKFGPRIVVAGMVYLLFTLAAACGGDDGNSQAGGVDSTGSSTGAGTGGDVTTGAASTGGSATGTSAVAADLDACALVTPEDVAEVLGRPAPVPGTEPVGPFATCAYYDTITAFVQFQVCSCLDADDFDRSVEAGAEVFDIEADEVPGIGDKAYWFEGILWVLQDDVSFNLWISRPDFFSRDGSALEGDAFKAVSLPVTQELAEKVISRLP